MDSNLTSFSAQWILGHVKVTDPRSSGQLLPAWAIRGNPHRRLILGMIPRLPHWGFGLKKREVDLPSRFCIHSPWVIWMHGWVWDLLLECFSRLLPLSLTSPPPQSQHPRPHLDSFRVGSSVHIERPFLVG